MAEAIKQHKLMAMGKPTPQSESGKGKPSADHGEPGHAHDGGGFKPQQHPPKHKGSH